MILTGTLTLRGQGEKITEDDTRYTISDMGEFDLIREPHGEDGAKFGLNIHLDESKRVSIRCEDPESMAGSEDIIIIFKDEEEDDLELILNREQAAILARYLTAHLDMWTAIDKLRAPAVA